MSRLTSEDNASHDLSTITGCTIIDALWRINFAVGLSRAHKSSDIFSSQWDDNRAAINVNLNSFTRIQKINWQGAPCSLVPLLAFLRHFFPLVRLAILDTSIAFFRLDSVRFVKS